jgi:hypothetical protein
LSSSPRRAFPAELVRFLSPHELSPDRITQDVIEAPGAMIEHFWLVQQQPGHLELRRLCAIGGSEVDRPPPALSPVTTIRSGSTPSVSAFVTSQRTAA